MPSARRSERVRAFGRTFELRSTSADEWIEAVTSDDMAGVFPGMVRDSDAADLFGLWHTLPDMQRRCINVARVATSRVSGREWFWAVNLTNEALKSWPYVNGMLIRQGVRTDSTEFADWLDAAFTLLREVLDKDARKAFEARLRIVPRGAVGAGSPRPVMSTRADLVMFAAD